jgi:hypothetical protein
MIFRSRPRTVTDHIREHLLARVGLATPTPGWDSPSFRQLQANRFEVGHYRHGGLDVGQYRTIDSAIARLERYRDDGNVEHLADVANLCQTEYVKACIGLGQHPRPTLRPIPFESNPDHTPKCQS